MSVGRIHSIQSMGTLDGPGVRFVAFLQGCNLRCGVCHNPDTWDTAGGTEMTAKELCCRAASYRDYFGKKGGITLSGGEPLLQAEFAREVFAICRKQGINTCIDTSGSVLNDGVKQLLALTDRVLLDIKYTSNEFYKNYVGTSLDKVIDFLGFLNERNIPTTLRQVIVPTVNDGKENIAELKRIAQRHKCVDKIELLPFKKICKVKYDAMGIDFTFDKYPTPTGEMMKRLEELL